MNTYDVINEEVKIPDIPINKWINVIIRCKNKNLDVYINGIITKSVQLLGVPKQNYGDVYVAMNGGFSGYLSSLKYYNKALGTNDIQSLVDNGPCIKLEDNSALTSKDNSYLATRWYFAGAKDGYN